MDSRYAVHDLPTAPRLGAFGLTRLPTAVEMELLEEFNDRNLPVGVDQRSASTIKLIAP